MYFADRNMKPIALFWSKHVDFSALLVFPCPLDNVKGQSLLRCLDGGDGDKERIKMKPGQKKSVMWNIGCECFHCAQAQHKRQNEKKYIFLIWLSQEKWWFAELEDAGIKRSLHLWVYHFSLWDWTWPPKEKEKTDWNLKSTTTKLYRKKEHLNVQVDFQTFFIKNVRKQSLEKKKVVFLWY